MKELNGLMAVFTSPRGNVVSVASFDKCNGFEEYQIRRQLAREVAKGYCAPDFFGHMDAENCYQIMADVHERRLQGDNHARHCPGGGTMPEVILPCPACGGDEHVIVRNSFPSNKKRVCCRCGTGGPLLETEAAAIAAWNSLPRVLTWTHEPPKVAGQYWQRKIGYPQSATIASIDDFGSGMRCKSKWGDRTIEKWSEFEWAGPIVPPIEA